MAEITTVPSDMHSTVTEPSTAPATVAAQSLTKPSTAPPATVAAESSAQTPTFAVPTAAPSHKPDRSRGPVVANLPGKPAPTKRKTKREQTSLDELTKRIEQQQPPQPRSSVASNLSAISNLYEEDSVTAEVMEHDASGTEKVVEQVLEKLQDDIEEGSLKVEESAQEFHEQVLEPEEVMVVPRSEDRYPLTEKELNIIQEMPLADRPPIFVDAETRSWYTDRSLPFRAQVPSHLAMQPEADTPDSPSESGPSHIDPFR